MEVMRSRGFWGITRMSSETTLGALFPCVKRQVFFAWILKEVAKGTYPEELFDAVAYDDGEHTSALGLYAQCPGGDRDLIRSEKVVLYARRSIQSLSGPATKW
jgi:hypothetical protein